MSYFLHYYYDYDYYANYCPLKKSFNYSCLLANSDSAVKIHISSDSNELHWP